MKSQRWLSVLVRPCVFGTVLWSCSSSSPGSNQAAAGAAPEQQDAPTPPAPGGSAGGALNLVVRPTAQAGSNGSAGAAQEPPTDPNGDGDGDGFTPAQGDCSDRDALVNPAAYDIPGTGIDEDCSGAADDEATDCDALLPSDGNDPFDAAKSLGLCKRQQGSGWGVVRARWVFPDGSASPDSSISPQFCPMIGATPNPESRALLSAFGSNVKPIQGGSMVVMSSGVARPGTTATMPGLGATPFAIMCTQGIAPAGFPKASPSCGDIEAANEAAIFDAVALELEIKTPSNAKSFAFDFDFYTSEWPAFVCQKTNDFFVALLESKTPGIPADKNISFDSKGNPVSVNSGFVDVCDPAVGATRPGGRDFPCSLGPDQLKDTSFDPIPVSMTSHAATGWLRTSSAIVSGETIRLRFAIWDGGSDVIWDSTVLLDHFTWELKAATMPDAPTPPMTERVEVLK